MPVASFNAIGIPFAPVGGRWVATILANADSTVARLSPKVDQISDELLKVTIDAGATTALREPIQADLGELRAAIEQARNLIGSLQTVVRANSDNINEWTGNCFAVDRPPLAQASPSRTRSPA